MGSVIHHWKSISSTRPWKIPYFIVLKLKHPLFTVSCFQFHLVATLHTAEAKLTILVPEIYLPIIVSHLHQKQYENWTQKDKLKCGKKSRFFVNL